MLRSKFYTKKMLYQELYNNKNQGDCGQVDDFGQKLCKSFVNVIKKQERPTRFTNKLMLYKEIYDRDQNEEKTDNTKKIYSNARYSQYYVSGSNSMVVRNNDSYKSKGGIRAPLKGVKTFFGNLINPPTAQQVLDQRQIIKEDIKIRNNLEAEKEFSITHHDDEPIVESELVMDGEL